ncbi:MAG: hypothetical protein FRX49_08520 [Trebouxia sp. A1-2]|nr:MAG: hypothetical protein FRX49_08520 [Trebouxia sp. A1-2]
MDATMQELCSHNASCNPLLSSIQHKVECSLLYLWLIKELQGSLIPFQQICLGLVQASAVATAPYKKANHCQGAFVVKDIISTQACNKYRDTNKNYKADDTNSIAMPIQQTRPHNKKIPWDLLQNKTILTDTQHAPVEMLKTNCFGKTTLVLHVPSLS